MWYIPPEDSNPRGCLVSVQLLYGIGSVIAKIVETLTSNTASILPVCSLANGEYGLDDVVIGLPSLVSHEGVKILDNYPLSFDELKSLHASAGVIKEVISNIN